MEWPVIREVRHFRDLIGELSIAFQHSDKAGLAKVTVMTGVDTNWGRESKGPIDRREILIRLMDRSHWRQNQESLISGSNAVN